MDIQQLETLLLQNRGFTGQADRRREDHRLHRRARAIEGRIAIDKGAFKSYRYDSLVANVDYRGTRIGIDATLQQSPTESITAQRERADDGVHGAKAGGEHVVPAAGEQIDLQITSTPIGLALVQGLTDVVTNVTGTLETDVHVTGSAQDPHLDGFIDIKNGGFGVPDLGGTFTGLTTRIDLQPDRVRIQQFQLLDHHGEKLTIAGELATHEGQVGAVNITIDSDNFELVDNELGDVQAQMALKVTGELRRPRVVGRREARCRARRARPDPAALLRSVRDRGAAGRGFGGARRSRQRQRGRSDEGGAGESGAVGAASPCAVPRPKASRARAPLFEAVELDIHVILPDNLVLRGNELRPGGPTGTALGDHEHHRRRRPADPQERRRAGDAHRHRDDRARHLRVPGAAVRSRARRHGPLHRHADDQPAARHHGDAEDSQHRRRRQGAHHRHAAERRVLALSSDPPLEQSDILSLIVFNRPVNELGSGERSSLAATAGGIATGFIAAPLGESIGKALDLDLFEITTTTDSGELGAGVTLGQQLGDRAFVKLRQQFGERSVTEFLIEYQLADFLRLQASASPEATGSANRVTQRRVETAGIDLIFFFSY